MKRLALWAGIGVAVVAALILATALALPYLLDTPRVQALAAAHASQLLGRPVRFASASVRLLPAPRVELRGLEVAEDPRFGTAPFLTLDRASLSLRLRPLLGRHLEFGELKLERPLITVVEGADGRFNIASLGVVVKAVTAAQLTTSPGRERLPKSAVSGTSLLAAGIVIQQGTVSFTRNASSGVAYRLVDLDLRLNGAGPGLTVAGRGLLTPGNVAVRVVDGGLGLGNGRSLADASVRGEVHFESDDVGPLVATLAPRAGGLTGRVHGTLNLGGVLGAPQASGSVVIPRAVIRYRNSRCRPPERTLTIEDAAAAVRWAEGTLLGQPLRAGISGGRVTANLAVSIGHGVRVVLSDISARGVSAAPALVDLLCEGYAITGQVDLSASLALQGADALQVSGDGRVSIGRGRVVGPLALRLFRDVVRTATLAASAVGEELPSPFEFESITGSYEIKDGVVTTRDLRYTGRGFIATAAGDYALATDRLDMDLLIRHRRERMTARITGTSAAPVLRVDALGNLREVGSKELGRGLRDLLRKFQ